MSYTYYQAKNPTTININDEHVTESELPERLLELNRKTTALSYEEEGDKTIIANTTETGNLNVTYATETYTLTVGSHATFTGSTFFNATINGYNIENELSKLQYLSTMDDITEVSGPFRASNLVGITYDADLNTTFFSGNLSSPNISAMSNNLSGVIYNPDDGTGKPLTEFNHNVFIDGNITADNIGTITTNMTGITYDPDGYEEPATRINQSLIVNGIVIANNIDILELKCTPLLYDPDTSTLSVNGNITATNITSTGTLNGNKIGAPNVFAYNNEVPFIPVVNSNGIMETGNRIDFHRATNEEDYTVGLEVSSLNKLTIRHTNTTYAGDLELGTAYYRNTSGACRLNCNHHSNLMWYNNSGTNTWVCDATGNPEKWSTTRDKASASDTRTTAMTYTVGTPDNTTIAGDLTVTGSIHGTLAGSQTITHKTKYIGTITPGCFVKSIGQIYREPTKVGITSTWNEPTEEGQTGYYTETQVQSSLSPYENCISIVKQAEGFSSNIIGVCTEVIDHEYCKFATHGDCLIKCESATYTCGDIIVPSINGYGKKGSSTDVLNCMLSMTPRLKVTSVDTDEIDPQCVVGFITV